MPDELKPLPKLQTTEDPLKNCVPVIVIVMPDVPEDGEID